LITVQLQLDLVRLLLSLSDWLDWSQQGITNHHKQVAFACLGLGEEIGLDDDSLSRLFKAASIHDIGAVTWNEKLSLTRFDLEHTRPHCRRGQYFVSESNLLSHLGTTILHHHDTWSGSNPGGVRGEEIPLFARIIHLCDRVSILIGRDDHVLNQRKAIVSRIRDLAGKAFDPELAAAFESPAQRESFWLDLAQPSLGFQLNSVAPVKLISSTAAELRDLAEVMAYAVDAKSRFTYRHSHGVAAVAQFLAQLCGFNSEKCTLLEIARILTSQAKSGGIDGDVVDALLSEANALEELWSQLSAKLSPIPATEA